MVVFSTPIFDNPNASDHSGLTYSEMGLHCHKQTLGTIARTSIKQGFVIGQNNNRCLGLVRRADLPSFPEERRTRFLENQMRILTSCGLVPEKGTANGHDMRSLVPGAGRLLIGCVAENNPKYLGQALRLVQSLRWFGGRIADANIMVCIVNQAEDEYVKEFRRWGAFVHIVPRFSYFHPQSNKLRLFDLPEVYAYDTIILMDCDTIVVQDLSPFITGDKFQAKIADGPTVKRNVFERLFAHYRLTLPEQKYKCTVTSDDTIWYCNAGVLIFPQPIMRSLVPLWRKYAVDLSVNLDLLGESANFSEQAALTLAFSESSSDFSELPAQMNFPLHRPQPKNRQTFESCDPVIIHYHDLVNQSGFIKGSPFRLVQARIDAFNERLKESRRKRFNNRLFWDFRYNEHPKIGSGLGSTGVTLEYKRDIIKHFIDTIKPGSVLDIGCGDQLVTKYIPDDIYTGIDISPVIIAKNHERYPKRRYVVGNFLNTDIPQFDLTICFDVVIHLDDKELYRSFIERVIRCTGAHGIISGYEKMPDLCSEITFFHEPLSDTLKWAGAREIDKVGSYRDTDIFHFCVSSDDLSKIPDGSALRKKLLRTSSKIIPSVSMEDVGGSNSRKGGLIEKQRVICVLGMHRSGTSSLAGSLEEAGVFLGNVQRKNPHNAKGNLEHLKIMELHDDLLAANGGSWDHPPEKVAWDERHRRMRDEIIREFEGVSLWAFKDPRTLYTLEGWREALPNMTLVGTFRHPSAVARSLNRRNGMPLEEGLNLWLKYNRRFLEYHRISNFPLISFDLPEGEYRRAMTALIKDLGLSVPTSGLSFFSLGLSHAQTKEEVTLPPEVKDVYKALKSISGESVIAVKNHRPKLSIIVVVFNMRREAARTLFSLSAGYQEEVQAADYEVIVVENGSSDPLSEEFVTSFGPNFRYYYLDTNSQSPVAAANYGVEKSSGDFVGIMIDGARLVTPGILRYALMALRMAPNPMVSTLAWHLGPDVQYRTTKNGYSTEVEDGLLSRIDWRANGYRLFEVSWLAGSSSEGFFKPLAESNFFFMPKKNFEHLGGYDEKFDLPGGGLANLDIYKRACEMPDAKLFIMLGEGSFHQIHAGVSTNATEEENSRLWHVFEKQYFGIRGRHYERSNKRAEYIGHVPPELLRFVRYSVEKAEPMHSQQSGIMETANTSTGQQELELKEGAIVDLSQANTSPDARLSCLEAALREKGIHIANLERQMEENYRDWQAHTKSLGLIIKDKDTQIGDLETSLRNKNATLNYIYHSYGLGALWVCNKIVDKLFPPNSKKRAFARLILKFIRSPKSRNTDPGVTPGPSL